MKELDRSAVGQRIKQMRLAARLRQRELAEYLGTTQSAVHKYENGVLPEPRRLVALARLGDTTVEWILMGEHWENGATEPKRPHRKSLELATRIDQFSQESTDRLEYAMDLLERAAALTHDDQDESVDEFSAHATYAALRQHGPETWQLLNSALRVQNEILSSLIDRAKQRVHPPAPPATSEDEEG